VDEVLQLADGGLVKAAAEVAGGGRVVDPAGAQSVEEDFVVAAEFEVLEAGAVAQGVAGEGQDVVGLVVGEVELEQAQATVDGLDEADWRARVWRAPMPPLLMPRVRSAIS
jgi:hypothetical protein